MDQKNFALVRDHLRSCESSSIDHDFSLELVEHVETLQRERAELVAELRNAESTLDNLESADGEDMGAWGAQLARDTRTRILAAIAKAGDVTRD